MFIVDSLLLLLAMGVFLIGFLIFNFSVLFFKSDKMLILFCGFGFLFAGISLFVYSFLLVTNIFMKV